MPYIKVNTNKIKTYTTELESAQKVINNTRQSFSNLYSSLDWDIRSATNIERRLEQIIDNLYLEANSTNNMKNYLQQAAVIYDDQENAKKEIAKVNFLDYTSAAASAFSVAHTATKAVKGVVGLANKIKNINVKKTIKGNKVFLKGYKKGSGLTSRYNKDTWIAKQSKLNALDKALLVIDGGIKTVNMVANLYNSYTDDSKTTEKKVCDTVANIGCTAASIWVKVAGTVASKAVTAAVSVAIPIPVVGSAIGFVAGCVVGKAVGAVADALVSERVINQVSDSVENVVGAVKAGCKVVSDKAKEVADAQGLDKVTKTAELVGAAVVETAKVVGTAVVEGIKTAATVVVESVKNFFKGW